MLYFCLFTFYIGFQFFTVAPITGLYYCSLVVKYGWQQLQCSIQLLYCGFKKCGETLAHYSTQDQIVFTHFGALIIMLNNASQDILKNFLNLNFFGYFPIFSNKTYMQMSLVQISYILSNLLNHTFSDHVSSLFTGFHLRNSFKSFHAKRDG